MISFVFNPAANRESLKDFNLRLREFCTENLVVNINAQALGQSLVVNCMLADEAEELGMPVQASLLAAVEGVSGTDVRLEERLEAFQQRVLNEATEQDERLILATQLVQRADKPQEGWAVLLIVIGEIEAEADDGVITPEVEGPLS